MDKEFKPIPIETTVAAFEEMNSRWLKKADEALSEYLGCDARIVQLGLNQLDEIAYEVVPWIEQTDEGCYPRECLTVLSKTMKGLVQRKDKLKNSAKENVAVPVLDLIGMEPPKNDGLLN